MHSKCEIHFNLTETELIIQAGKQAGKQDRFKFGPTNVMQRLTDSVFNKKVY